MRQALSYENFDVLLERSGEGGYRARVVYAPAGQGARVAFAQPFASLELENFLLRIGRPRRPVRRVDAPETKAVKAFGERLYRALFHGELWVSLERSLSEAAAKAPGCVCGCGCPTPPSWPSCPGSSCTTRSATGLCACRTAPRWFASWRSPTRPGRCRSAPRCASW